MFSLCVRVRKGMKTFRILKRMGRDTQHRGAWGLRMVKRTFFSYFFSISPSFFFFFSFWLCKQYLLIVKNLENREMLENM